MNHEKYMARALELANIAQSLGEVPVGALVVVEDKIVAEAYNQRELNQSSLDHAELLAIRLASHKLGRWRLTGSTVYSSLEPCLMCAGALMHARINLLVYGAKDAKFGAIDSLYQVAQDQRLNHQFATINGVLAEQSAELLKSFFRQLRLDKYSVFKKDPNQKGKA